MQKKMEYRQPVLLMILTLVLALFFCGDTNAREKDKAKILVLNSYHSGFQWTEDIIHGIRTELGHFDRELELSIEFMDSKRHSPGKIFPTLKKLYQRKYQDHWFDVVIASDDNALNFLLQNRESLFVDTPIVFCGVNHLKNNLLDKYSDITGVVESVDIAGTINLALELFPGVKNIAVVSDRTPSDTANRERLETIKPAFEDRINFIELVGLTDYELKSKLALLSPKTLVLFFGFIRDADDNVFSIKESIQLVVENSHVPTFTMWKNKVNHGILGGIIVSGVEQGKRAAQMAGQIIQGVATVDIPIIKTSPNVPMFNYQQLERFNINTSDLPEDSVILNQTTGFYSQYKFLIWLTLAVIVVQTFLTLSLWHNIVRRRQHEKDLASAHQQLKQVLDAASLVSIIATNSEGLIKIFNTGAERMLGYKAWEMVNKNTPAIFHLQNEIIQHGEVLSREYQRSINGFEVFVTRAKEGRYEEREWTYVCKGGEHLKVNLGVTAVRDEKGTITGFLGVATNITERIRKEQEQHEILNTMMEGVISVDEKGRVLTFNKAAEGIFGYTAKEIIGQKVNCLMPDKFASKHDGFMKQYLATGQAKVIGNSVEVEAMRRDNSVFPMRLALADLPIDNDGTHRFIGSCQDLTEQKLQEEKLRQSQKMDALGKLTGGIAHDYNNMLAVILGYTELLENEVKDGSKIKIYIKYIRQAAERSKKMTDKLLLFSRKKISNAEKGDINHVLLHDQDMLAKSLTARVELKMQLCDSPWPVFLDIAEFQDMVLNMAINAQHAMPDGGSLLIKTENKSLESQQSQHYDLPSGDYLLLTIVDSGAGMDEETLSKIFDPFFSTKGKNGTGLGLSQVFGFIERSNGKIDVSSQLGVGTRFEIYLPRFYETNHSEVDQITNKNVEYTGTETILVVDDEQAVRDMVKEMLSSEGYQVLSAQDAGQALALLQQNSNIDLMISDVVMAKMDGYQLAEQVMQLYPHIKIQMASGYSGEELNLQVSESLKMNLLNKPYSKMALLKRVRRLIEQ